MDRVEHFWSLNCWHDVNDSVTQLHTANVEVVQVVVPLYVGGEHASELALEFISGFMASGWAGIEAEI